jgi:hypothetical protein
MPYPYLAHASHSQYQPSYPKVMLSTPPMIQTQTHPTIQIHPTQFPSQSPNFIQTQKRQYNEKKRVFDPIPMSYTELFKKLINNSLIVPIPLNPVQPPYPKGYDANARCEYHAGAIGHSTKNCYGLKHKVQDLIDAKWLTFKEESPNVGSDPLPHHEGPSGN